MQEKFKIFFINCLDQETLYRATAFDTWTHAHWAPSPSISGKHTFKAYFSGNTTIANAVSNEVTLESASVQGVSADFSDLRISPRKGGVEILSASTPTRHIYTVAGEKVKTVKTINLPLLVSLDKGLYIIANEKFAID